MIRSHRRLGEKEGRHYQLRKARGSTPTYCGRASIMRFDGAYLAAFDGGLLTRGSEEKAPVTMRRKLEKVFSRNSVPLAGCGRTWSFCKSGSSRQAPRPRGWLGMLEFRDRVLKCGGSPPLLRVIPASSVAAHAGRAKSIFCRFPLDESDNADTVTAHVGIFPCCLPRADDGVWRARIWLARL